MSKRFEVGDTLKIWTIDGRLLGGRRRGFAVNGEVYEYQTAFDLLAERIKMLADFDRRDRENAKAAREQIAEWLETLEGPFRARIERFLSTDPMFALGSGMYETYPVLMAQRIARYVSVRYGVSLHPETWKAATDYQKVREYVEEFRRLPHDEQAKVVHAGGTDHYGISGHQFDAACGIAARVMGGQEV